ncbi:MAG: hypothetical protein N3F07_00035 [Candidatus Micrarchaeota archaeon]|nr:hypothetical protein [Candidatus Micrarchaeota archaeon]
MEKKLGAKDALAAALIFAACIGLGQMQNQSTLPEFLQAISIRNALEGSPSPMHIQFASYFVMLYASLAGLPANSSQAINNALLLLSPAVLAFSSILLFLALRGAGFARAISALIPLLLCLPLSAQDFLPGYYGSLQLAILPFSAFLALLAFSKNQQALLLPSAIFAAISGYLSFELGLAAAAVSASSALSERQKAMPIILLALACLAASFLSPTFSKMSFSASSISSSLQQFFALFSLAACSAVLYFFGMSSPRSFLSSLLGFVLSGFSPVAAGATLAFSAAEGASALARQDIPKPAKLFGSFALGFVSVFGLALGLAGFSRAAAIGLLGGSLAPLLMHFYDYSNRVISAAFFAFLFASTAFSAILMASSEQAAERYFDSDMAKALSFMESQGASQVYALGSSDAVRFYLPHAKLGNQSAFSSYIYLGSGELESGSFAVLSLRQIYSGQFAPRKPDFVPLRHLRDVEAGGKVFSIYSSGDGVLVARELDADGNFALSDGILLDSSGNQYGTAPLSRLVPLKKAPQMQSLLLWVDEGAPMPSIARVYSNKTRLSHLKDFGQASVFKVD